MWLPGAGVGAEDSNRSKPSEVAKNSGELPLEDAKSTKVGTKITKPVRNIAIFIGEEVLAYE